jgi:hypothetical protein
MSIASDGLYKFLRGLQDALEKLEDLIKESAQTFS